MLLMWILAVAAIVVLQTGLVALIIMGRTLRVIVRFKLGLETKPPWLPFVWSYYITDEEKRSAMSGK